MKRVLHDIESGRLFDIVEVGEEFEVAPTLKWVDAPDAVTHEWVMINGRPELPIMTESLGEARRRKLNEVTQARMSAMTQLKVTVEGVTFDADEASVQRMTGAIIMLQLFANDPRAPKTIGWLDTANQVRQLTPQQLSNVAAACWLAQQQVWSKNSTAKVAVESADSVDQVNAIAWQ